MNDASFAERLRRDGCLSQGGQLLQIHDVVFHAEDVRESALRHAAMQRHLAAFKTAHHARTTARALALMSAGGSLTHAGTHAAPDAFLAFVRLLRCSNIRKIHKKLFFAGDVTSLRPQFIGSQPGAGSLPPCRGWPPYPDVQSPDSIA